MLILSFWLKPGATTPASARSSPTPSTTPASSAAHHGAGFLFYVLPLSAILTQYTITGYDASAHLSEETKSAANSAAKGIWQSIFYSAIGGWILLLSFLFAVQDEDGVTTGGGAVAVHLQPGADHASGAASCCSSPPPASSSARWPA